MEQVEVDNAVLATLITVLLIRSGGQLVVTPEEWRYATEDDGSLFVRREGEDKPVQVILLRKTVKE